MPNTYQIKNQKEVNPKGTTLNFFTEKTSKKEPKEKTKHGGD